MAEKRSSDDSNLNTPQKRTHRKMQPFPTPPNDALVNQTEQSIGVFKIDGLEKHPNWVGNVTDYAWKPRTSAFLDLMNSQGKLLTVVLFGKVLSARVGIYGDYNEIYHQSLLSPGIRNLVWKLGPPAGYADQFFTQFSAIQKIENALDKDMESSQRSAKAASDLELKRKLLKKVDNGSPVTPVDTDGRDFWKKAKEQRFCFNQLPGGIMDGFKKSIPLEEWEPYFEGNPNVLVNAIIRATSYKGKKFIQLVPTAITEIKLEAFTENEADLEFFQF